MATAKRGREVRVMAVLGAAGGGHSAAGDALGDVDGGRPGESVLCGCIALELERDLTAGRNGGGLAQDAPGGMVGIADVENAWVSRSASGRPVIVARRPSSSVRRCEFRARMLFGAVPLVESRPSVQYSPCCCRRS